MEDGSQPEYAFNGGRRSSIVRFDISFHLASGEKSSVAEARSATSMTFLLNSGESTWGGLEALSVSIALLASSGESTLGLEACSVTVSMALLLSSCCESTLLGLEKLKRGERRKERGDAYINDRERIHDDQSRCMRSKEN